MRRVLEWESSTTYIGYPEELLTCTLICEMTQKKGYINTVNKARNYDERYLHSGHSCQSGHTSTGDHALREYPATKYEYTRGIEEILGTRAFQRYVDTPIQTLDGIVVNQPKWFLPLAQEAKKIAEEIRIKKN